jgi:hypothetical protein
MILDDDLFFEKVILHRLFHNCANAAISRKKNNDLFSFFFCVRDKREEK